MKAAAIELGIPVAHDVDATLALDPPADLGVVAAFGRLIKPHVLARIPMVNLHFSALPRWRGAAPVERAILAGDTTTAVCLMEVEEGLDTGGVYRRADVEIAPDETADELRARLVKLGTDLLLDALGNGLGEPVPQTGEPTYATKIDHGELRLDWSRSASELHRVVRVGGAWTTFRGRRLLVWRASLDPVDDAWSVPAGDGRLWLTVLQSEGKPRLSAADWLRGARVQPGKWPE